MRRTIALTITALMALALAPFGVAQAQQGQQEQFEDPKIRVTFNQPADGATVTGNVQFDVNIKTNRSGQSHSIHQWIVEFIGSDTHQVCTHTYQAPNPFQGIDPVHEVNLKFKWDSHRVPTDDVDLPCEGAANPTLGGVLGSNGTYTVNVYADTFGTQFQAPVSHEKAVDLTANNRPSVPSGVALNYKAAEDRISVSWNANPEPDVTTYKVQECRVDRSSKPCDTDDWSTVDDVSATSLTVRRTTPGIYRFRVAALRGSLISNGAGTPQSDPTEITVEEDPDPTTSTTEPADDDDGDQTASTPEPETRTVVKPTRRVQRAAPQVLQRIVEEDPGYQDELPYENDDEEAISGLPIDGNNEDGDGQLSTLVPLAGGLTLLIFALQLWYLNNRAGRTLEPIPVDAYGPDEGWDE